MYLGRYAGQPLEVVLEHSRSVRRMMIQEVGRIVGAESEESSKG